jgi:signal transduction histidine kinase
MTRLIDDLLDVSRITRGRIELRSHPIDLRDVLLAAREATLPLVESARQVIELAVPDAPLPMVGDAARLTQVIANLLNNASKFMDPAGKIQLSVEKMGEGYVVTVRDEGIGIPLEFQSSVFDMFTQVDRSLERSKGGLGIGLALARTIVELHAAPSAIQSEGDGKGSTVTVKLPSSVAQAQEKETRPGTVDGDGDGSAGHVRRDGPEEAGAQGLSGPSLAEGERRILVATTTTTPPRA